MLWNFDPVLRSARRDARPAGLTSVAFSPDGSGWWSFWPRRVRAPVAGDERSSTSSVDHSVALASDGERIVPWRDGRCDSGRPDGQAARSPAGGHRAPVRIVAFDARRGGGIASCRERRHRARGDVAHRFACRRAACASTPAGVGRGAIVAFSLMASAVSGSDDARLRRWMSGAGRRSARLAGSCGRPCGCVAYSLRTLLSHLVRRVRMGALRRGDATIALVSRRWRVTARRFSAVAFSSGRVAPSSLPAWTPSGAAGMPVGGRSVGAPSARPHAVAAGVGFSPDGRFPSLD